MLDPAKYQVNRESGAVKGKCASPSCTSDNVVASGIYGAYCSEHVEKLNIVRWDNRFKKFFRIQYNIYSSYAAEDVVRVAARTFNLDPDVLRKQLAIDCPNLDQPL